ncbi:MULTISPECIES: CBU_0592 family membrane protein [Corallincola]|uniref:CBU-0592-like domain-containing protein n=2 Tax=Corallincola TaxID=1775176 RepID=A0A368N5P5_9GAMM|nr:MULTISPECIES: hypothetical protein [Corallincola]RCU45460.1 hypothetical protein DU002_15490 [Corallincola holothuriorum]TAA41030.1 hypothetical protein EXY25_17160 [Corallincola spongiicola]
MDLFNFIGALGGVLYLASYLLLNAGKVSGNSYEYIGLNLAASTCMAISLFVHWNGPSFTAQLCWIVISGVGLVNCYLESKHKAKESVEQLAAAPQIQQEMPTQLNA